MIPGAPNPINLNGGHASASTGDQTAGGTVFGAFNYSQKPPYVLFAVVGLVAVWMISKR